MTENVKLLLHIDDDRDDFLLIKDMLSDIQTCEYRIDWASNQEEGLALLKTKKYDLCLLDYRLGVTCGLDFLDMINSMEIEVPVILLTGQGDENVDRKAMQKGAIDYIVKGRITSKALERLIRYAISNHEAEILRREAAALKNIKELAAGVAHEFSQPLQALLNYVSIMRESPNSKAYLDKCHQSIHTISELTKNLRNIVGLEKKEYLDTQILDILTSSSTEEITNINPGFKILVVDDEQEIQDTMTEMFNMSGFSCVGVGSGEEGLSLLATQEFDLIISDVMMPGMTGPEFFNEVRRRGYRSPFILITGYEISDDVKEAAQKADGLFTKPVSFGNFINALHQKGVLRSVNRHKKIAV